MGECDGNGGAVMTAKAKTNIVQLRLDDVRDNAYGCCGTK